MLGRKLRGNATLARAINSVLRPIWRMRRGFTLGAQGVVIDAEGHVLLVRHSYRPGWFFPGGGVEWDETLETALARELDEEVGVTLTEAAKLHGVFSNFRNFPGDHIALFVVRHWQRRDDYRKLGEIAEARMFSREDLPERIDPGTRARIAEIFDGTRPAPLW
jgi:ADP-ribose pyrophosphatase YjhB (NUDIX family)